MFKCLLKAENSMTGRAYMGEMLIQGWLKSIYLTKRECTKREFEKTSEAHTSFHKPMKKCAMNIEVETTKNVTGLKHFDGSL